MLLEFAQQHIKKGTIINEDDDTFSTNQKKILFH